MPTRVIQVDPDRFAPEAVAPAVKALRAGRLVAFPTETVYGLGTVATIARAVERLRQVKSRSEAAFTVHLSGPEEARRYVRSIPAPARALMNKAWPGPLTVLLPTDGRLPDPSLRGKALYDRICPQGVVGLRCPDDRVALDLLRRAGRPVLASSANLAGKPAPHSAGDVLSQLDGKIDLLVDAGPTRYSQPSSIVAFDGPQWRIVREGVLDAGTIQRMSRVTVLFVCTGNTCRSPLAEALARKMLSERLGAKPDGLTKAGVEVTSAGVLASGAAASREAIAAAAALGARIGRHRSRKLTGELIRSADVILCMTARHLEEVKRLVPAAAGRADLLDADGDIEDPIGGDERAYLQVARRIAGSLERRIEENWP